MINKKQLLTMLLVLTPLLFVSVIGVSASSRMLYAGFHHMIGFVNNDLSLSNDRLSLNDLSRGDSVYLSSERDGTEHLYYVTDVSQNRIAVKDTVTGLQYQLSK